MTRPDATPPRPTMRGLLVLNAAVWAVLLLTSVSWTLLLDDDKAMQLLAGLAALAFTVASVFDHLARRRAGSRDDPAGAD